MVKRVLIIVLTAMLLSCGTGQKRVGLLVYSLRDPYIKTFTEHLLFEADSQMNLITADALVSQIIQNEQIEDFIEEKPQVLIINPVDRLGAHAVIRKLKKYDIPVIFFNRQPLEEDLKLWDKVWYVGAAAHQSGRMQAQLVMDLFGGDPRHLNQYDRNGDGRIQAVILKGEQGHQDAEIRTSDGIQAFNDQGFHLDVLATRSAEWKTEEAYDQMKILLNEFGNTIEVVISNNDAMAMGAISIMRQRGFFRDTNGNNRIDPDDEQWIPVVGIDGLEEAFQLIEQGYLYGTVINDSKTQALAIIELAEMICGIRSPKDFDFTILEGKYIWVDYKTFSREEIFQ